MALMCPGEDITATRELIAELLGDESNRGRVAALLGGTDVGYDMGAYASHPLVGQWFPGLQAYLAGDRTPIAERLRAARPVLADFTEDSVVAGIAAGWKDRVDLVAALPGDKPLPASAVLVRPDGYIAWAASVGSHERPAHHGLREALSTWFGAAS
ncbi:aromatic-ring hydroxylase C-terminal domain-containing protein [Streptomyces fagopyri]|uniref:aromatic-ring hydroxylase C-terminal domain-containing protein n=1 Tax=Streptomyces fagopyri TaxID=2662397 RepID=UPI003817ACF7